ncbi:ataxin-3-like [Anoplophora glabripennis]|uniref:ataxin-3-like n=1 Tax=Anoplophora glabripennis TaxID=217634 RepID=UPI000874C5C8|nr:ataxin-3-like [Anoplophora glabripennis]
MEAIFHEKQEGSLCAQHCLNSLLQGPYFTAVDLSTLAQKLDEEERQRMAECGEESEEYQKFLQQPSGNMDDSGYFSVQVISSALQVWGLELVPYSSTDERINMNEPSKMKAFICNYKDHWFTIRKIGNQWFNLNSLLTKPELISDTYLTLFLAQLKNEGYSIFVVFGDFPECSADEVLKNNPVMPTLRQSLRSVVSNENDPDIQAALQLSLREEQSCYTPETEDQELQEALRLSLQNFNSSPEEDDEEALLEKAINMSLQC